jgi:photosystem II stability/assembly factor-like uncharacterized protein
MNDDFENRLRAELADQARHAPHGDALAEQIIAASSRRGPAEVTSLHQHRHPRTWMYPLIAAAAVAAVALTLFGVSRLGGSNEHVAGGGTTTPATTQHATSTAPSHSPTESSSPVTPSTTMTVDGVNPNELLTHVRVLDLTFVSDTEGWALATADCLDPTSTAPACPAMLKTTNAGTSWTAVPNPPANIPIDSSCAEPCIQHIRFATDQIGYAYGSTTLLMTVDGGKTWTRQPGGADALETLDGNVIRVSTACLPGCPYRAQTAPIGSASWHAVALPGAQAGMNSGVGLTRTGARAFIAIYGHVAGGASSATSVLFTSADNGASWQNRGEPCRQSSGQEIDTSQLTSAADGSVTVLCTTRGGQGQQFTETSTDGGITFRPGALDALGAAPVSAIGAATSSELFVSSDDTYRSVNGGRTWTRQHANGGTGPAELSWFGFESSTAGRAVSADGSVIWTTQDAGLTWTAHSFG